MSTAQARTSRRIATQLGSAKTARRAADELKQLLQADPSFGAAFATLGGVELLAEALGGPAPSLAKSIVAHDLEEVITQLQGIPQQRAIVTAVAKGVVPEAARLALASTAGQRVRFCALLWRMAQSDATKQSTAGGVMERALSQPEVMRQLVSMLTPLPTDAMDVVLADLLCLSIGRQNPGAIVQAGALPPLMHMIARGRDANAKRAASQCLFTLATHGRVPDLASGGCLPVLLAAARAHRTAEKLEPYFAAFVNITQDHAGCAALIDADGVEILFDILRHMRREEADNAKRPYVADVLSSLFRSPRRADAQAAVLACGGLEVMADNIGFGGTQYPEDSFAGALVSMIPCPGFFPAFLAAGAIPKLIRKLSGCVLDPGLLLLTMLTASSENLPAAVEPLMMVRRLSSAQKQAELAASGHDRDKQCEAIIAAGGVAAVVEILEEGLCGSEEEEANCVQILGALAASGPAGVSAVIEVGGLGALLGLDWTGKAAVLIQACDALREIARKGDADALAALRDSRAVPFLAAQLWSGYLQLQLAAVRALQQMRHAYERAEGFYRALNAVCGAAALLVVTMNFNIMRPQEELPSLLLARLLEQPACSFSQEELRRLGAWPHLAQIRLGAEASEQLRGNLQRCLDAIQPDGAAPIRLGSGGGAPVGLPAPAELVEKLKVECVRVGTLMKECDRLAEAEASPAQGWPDFEYGTMLAGLPLVSGAQQDAIAYTLREQARRLPRVRELLVLNPDLALSSLLHVVEFGASHASRFAVGTLRNMAVGNNAFREKLCEAGAVELLVGRLKPGLFRSDLEAMLGALRTLARGGDSFRLRIVRAGGLEALVRILPRSRKGADPSADRGAGSVEKTLRVLAETQVVKVRLLKVLPRRWVRRLGVVYSQIAGLPPAARDDA